MMTREYGKGYDEGYADGLKDAIEQAQKQEPVAWYHPEDYKTHFTSIPSQDMIENGYWQPLYTSPPPRQPLTHEQRVDLLTKFEPHKNKWEALAILIDMVEAAHGIKGKA